MKQLIFLSLLLGASSCAFHAGNISGSHANGTGDLKFVDVAVGNSHAKYFLGIGGNRSDALVMDAKRNMYLKTPLKRGQEYYNLTVDFKTSYFFIFTKREVTVSADVVEKLSGQEEENLYSENYLNKVSRNKLLTHNYLKLDEKVFLHTPDSLLEAEVVDLKKDIVSVNLYNKKGRFKIKDCRYDDVFKTTNTEKLSADKGFSMGDEVLFVSKKTTNTTNSKPVTTLGIIKGLNYENALVEIANGDKYSIKYSLLGKKPK